MGDNGGTKRPSSSEDSKRPHHSQHQSSSTISTTTTANTSGSAAMPLAQAHVQTAMRPSKDRPLLKLSIDLIDTYKFINKGYYEQKAKKKLQREASSKQSDPSLHGRWDDDNYDYIVKENEDFGEGGRYTLKEKIGKVRQSEERRKAGAKESWSEEKLERRHSSVPPTAITNNILLVASLLTAARSSPPLAHRFAGFVRTGG